MRAPFLGHLPSQKLQPPTEEDALRNQADEALDYLHDREIFTFYEEAKKKAATRRLALDPGSG